VTGLRNSSGRSQDGACAAFADVMYANVSDDAIKFQVRGQVYFVAREFGNSAITALRTMSGISWHNVCDVACICAATAETSCAVARERSTMSAIPTMRPATSDTAALVSCALTAKFSAAARCCLIAADTDWVTSESWSTASATPDNAANFARSGLNLSNLGADPFSRLPGLGRQRLDLGGHHRKAAPGLARARRLDGSIERQQVGLRRDLVDHRDNIADLVGRLAERIDGHARSIGARHRFVAKAAAAPHLHRDLGACLHNLVAQLAGSLVHGVQTLGGARSLIECRPNGLQRRQHFLGFKLQCRGASDNRLNTALGRGLHLACQIG